MSDYNSTLWNGYEERPLEDSDICCVGKHDPWAFDADDTPTAGCADTGWEREPHNNTDRGLGNPNYALCQADDDMISIADFQAFTGTAGQNSAPARQCCQYSANVGFRRTLPTYRHSYDV
jgi:hypothetical protein